MNRSDKTRREFLALTGCAAGSVLAQKNTEASTSASKYVSLKDAHKGTLEIDLRIMNQYEAQPQETLEFYTACRKAFATENPNEKVAAVCQSHGRQILGGPLLGDISTTGVSVWMHLPEPTQIKIVIENEDTREQKSFVATEATRISSIPCQNLSPDTSYRYQVFDEKDQLLGEGQFTTFPVEISEKPFRISFGADFHKAGMYRPHLVDLVRERGSRAMLLIGDSAVDGRKEEYPLIESDYLLRNLSGPLQNLFRQVPTSATWDDHDYWGDDTSGIQHTSGTPINVVKLRQTWKDHWNNPERDVPRKGIYFECHLGPIHYLALDTRSCRIHPARGKKGCFLGNEQMAWLKKRIKESSSPFLLISSGTMWTDYISRAKDTWGTWDTKGREEIFQLIDAKKNTTVILLSGDRHGARGFQIPRPNGKPIHELEVGTLGGCPGPEPFGKDRSAQIFGQPSNTWAVGELTFDIKDGHPRAIFRLHNEEGRVLETVTINGSQKSE